MTKRVSKSADGKYHIKGKSYTLLKGSRAQVWHGTAFKTCLLYTSDAADE